MHTQYCGETARQGAALRRPGPHGRKETGSNLSILKDTKGRAAPRKRAHGQERTPGRSDTERPHEGLGTRNPKEGRRQDGQRSGTKRQKSRGRHVRPATPWERATTLP